MIAKILCAITARMFAQNVNVRIVVSTPITTVMIICAMTATQVSSGHVNNVRDYFVVLIMMIAIFSISVITARRSSVRIV